MSTLNVFTELEINNNLDIAGNLKVTNDSHLNTIISNHTTDIHTNGNYIDISGSALIIPRSSTSNRINTDTQPNLAQLGMIVYDTTKHQYLGIVEYEGQKKWAGLGGVISIDQKTRIEAYNDNDPAPDISGLHFYTNDVHRMIINKQGNVGIGTKFPTSGLSIIGGRQDGGDSDTHPIGCHLGQDNKKAYLELCDLCGCRIDFANGSNDFSGRILYDHEHSMSICTNSTEKIKILQDGKVGINVANPTSALSIVGGRVDESHPIGCHLGQDGNKSYLELCGSDGGYLDFAKGDSSDDYRGRIFYDNNSNFMSFSTVALERMRIHSSGNVGIGTITPDYLLHVAGTTLIDQQLLVKGDVVAFYNSSDKSLKTNIETIKNPLKILENIRGVRFNWNEKARDINKDVDLNKKEMGVIAQEVEEHIPEIIKEGLSGYKAVRYEKLSPLLIQCIKEQQTQIQSLQKQINELKNLCKKC